MKEAGELYWLLKFFSQPLQEQWAQLPDRLDQVWVHFGEIDTATDQPVRVLALVFAELLNGCGSYLDSAGSDGSVTLEVLDELRVLLDWFMLESLRDIIFMKLDEPDQLHTIWRTMRRLCLATLDQPAIHRWKGEDLSFQYFLAKYTVPAEG
jgi:hypothetical protein